MAKDGSSKVIIILGPLEKKHAHKLAVALNAKPAFNAHFKFDTLAMSNGDIAITATGSWHLPGNQRPAHGMMQTWAEGYVAALSDATVVAVDTMNVSGPGSVGIAINS